MISMISPVRAARQGGRHHGWLQRGRGVVDNRVLLASEILFFQFDESRVLLQAPHLYDVVRQLWPVLGPYSLLGVIIIRLHFNSLTIEAIAILLVQSN